MPVLVKPATPTAYVAEAAVRLMVDSGALPDGAVQLVCGSLGDAFDHLTGQDSVFFTGSAATATKLRSHPVVLGQSVRFTAEADSLNASVLGPAAGPGTAEFDLYVKEVAREMTTKAGQRCTAIRRALVPAGLVDDVVSALSDRLAKVVVGDPRREEVRMGPLVSLEQRLEVERAVATLAGGAEVAIGGPDGKLEPLGDEAGTAAPSSPPPCWWPGTPRPAPSTTSSRSGRCAPCCPTTASTRRSTSPGWARAAWWCRSSPPMPPRPVAWPSASAPTTAGCWWSTSGAARPRPAMARPCPTSSTAARAGPAAARSWAASGRCTTTSSGWRCRVRPTRCRPSTGTFLPGATRKEGGPHPFTKHFEDLEVGDSLTSGKRTITLEDIDRFADLTGDHFYAHTDEEAAAKSPIFGGRVAHGYFVIAAAAGLFVWPDPGPVLANYGIDRLRFTTPVKPGDEIHVVFTCKEKSPRQGAGYGEVRWDTQVVNQDGAVVAAYDVLTMVATKEGAQGK